MTPSEIETIRKKGEESTLLQAINDQMWGARSNCKQALEESCVNFFLEVNEATQAIENAKLIYAELMLIKMRK